MIEASERASTPRTDPPVPARLPLRFAAAFTASGVAGLAYELVWTRYLALIVGHAAYAQVLVLAAYLGGTALGSLLVARRARSIPDPLRSYARVEIALGLFGFGFHALYLGGQGALYGWLAPWLTGGSALRTASWSIAILLILPQAVLLGATFPLMGAGLVRRRPGASGRSVADVYLLNTLGGAAGILIAGFLLVPRVGLPATAAAAGALNLLAAALAWRSSPRGEEPAARDALPAPLRDAAESWVVPLLLASTFVSALASFLYEIGWVRMLSLLLGSATHSFELMLSAFLVGLGTGSLLVRRLADRATRPLRVIGAVQGAMGLAALLTLPVYELGFPALAWMVRNLPATDHGYLLFNAGRYAIALAVMLPATLLAGMTLPLVTATLLRRGGGERMIGIANGANTLGSVLGAVAGGLLVLPGLGLEGTVALGAGLDMAVGVALLAAAAPRRRALAVGGAAGALAAALLLAVTASVGLDRALLTSGVYRAGRLPGDDGAEVVFYEDGATATVSAHRTRSGFVTLETNGKTDASLSPRWLERARGGTVVHGPISGGDESTQVYAPLILLAHRPEARRAAVIGHGSGMSAQLLLGSSRLESLTTIEIEPAILRGSRAFAPANRRPFEDPRSTFVLDDARIVLAGGRDSLDVIFSEPSNPWVSGVSSLFTEQFYARVREGLAEDGVFGQWFHLYDMEDELVLTVLAAIDRSFPDWSAWLSGRSDLLIVAGKNALREPDWGVAREPGIQAELSFGPPPTPGQLESLRLFDDDTLGPLLSGHRANGDYHPILDTRAERARFVGRGAEGFVAFTTAALDLPRILARRRLAPVPYDSLAITDVVPVTARALAGWLVAGAQGSEPPYPDWAQARRQEAAFDLRVSGSEPPLDWGSWAVIFVQVETTRHARSAGWVDADFYDAVERYLARHDVPADARATVELLKGIRTFDFARAAAAADVLGATAGPSRIVPTPLLLDASVAAYLGAGRGEDARAALQALAPYSGRLPSNARNLWLAALVGAAAR